MEMTCFDSTHIPLAISLITWPHITMEKFATYVPTKIQTRKEQFWWTRSIVFTSDIQLGKFRRQRCEAESQKSEPQKILKNYYYINGT